MNALDVLKWDHQKVRELFQEAARAEDHNKRKEIFNKIATELETHAHIEEIIFYPVLEQHDELSDMVAETFADHQEIKASLEDIAGLAADSHEFNSQLEILMASVEDHVTAEEGVIFPQVCECFDENELEQLGNQLESAKGVEQKRAS